MCLFFGQGYGEVMRLLAGGLGWTQRWAKAWEVPSTGAISRAPLIRTVLQPGTTLR